MIPRLSVRIASVAGVPVRVHLLLPAALLVAVAATPGWTAREALLSHLLFAGTMVASLLLREGARALACRRHGAAVRGILLGPLGATASHDPPRRPRGRRDAILAGSAAHLLLAALAGGAALLRDGRLPGFPVLAVVTDPLATAWNLNLALALLNLLPGHPFDGGALVEGVLLPRTGRARARFVVIGTGFIAAAGLLAGGVTHGEAWLAALGLFGLAETGRAWAELREGGLLEEALHPGARDPGGVLPLPEPAAPPDRPRPREKVLAGERGRREEESKESRERRERARAATRLDDLLERIGREGMGSLTPDDRAFLDAESRRLRERGR